MFIPSARTGCTSVIPIISADSVRMARHSYEARIWVTRARSLIVGGLAANQADSSWQSRSRYLAGLPATRTPAGRSRVYGD